MAIRGYPISQPKLPFPPVSSKLKIYTIFTVPSTPPALPSTLRAADFGPPDSHFRSRYQIEVLGCGTPLGMFLVRLGLGVGYGLRLGLALGSKLGLRCAQDLVGREDECVGFRVVCVGHVAQFNFLKLLLLIVFRGWEGIMRDIAIEPEKNIGIYVNGLKWDS
eukprot:188522-Amorphochlora_amoeboformis.AAC.1